MIFTYVAVKNAELLNTNLNFPSNTLLGSVSMQPVFRLWSLFT